MPVLVPVPVRALALVRAALAFCSVGRGTAEERVARALAVFAAGDRRAAWESLRTLARREPGESAYRRALVQTYRAAGHIDQSARWGASDPGSLDERELRILRRLAAQSSSEADLHAYLVLPGALPSFVAEALPTRAAQLRRRGESVAEVIVAVVAIALFFAVPAVAIGLGVTLVQAFLGRHEAQEAAQITATVVLFSVAGLGTLLLPVTVLRGWWVRAALVLVLVVTAVVVLAHVDMTSMTPFA